MDEKKEKRMKKYRIKEISEALKQLTITRNFDDLKSMTILTL